MTPGSGSRSKPIIKILISVLSAVVLTLSAASAEGHEPPKPEPIRGYISIQLPSFSVPVVARDGWLGRGTISMFLVVRGQKNVEIFCRYMPRVREAITLTVDQTPIPIPGQKYQLKKIGTLLHRAINEILPKPLIFRLHLLANGWSMGKDAVDLELPGTDSRCMALREIPEPVLALFRGENPEAKTSSVPDPEAGPKPRTESRPELPKSEVRIIPRLLPPGSVPSRSASAPSKASKIDIPAWQPNAQGQKLQDPKNCRNLSNVWAPGNHKAGGRTYWLGRAFTLDDDNDGVVDNVGFILRPKTGPIFTFITSPARAGNRWSPCRPSGSRTTGTFWQSVSVRKSSRNPRKRTKPLKGRSRYRIWPRSSPTKAKKPRMVCKRLENPEKRRPETSF